ncbi:MAG: hypothetical protein RR359_04440 [Bacilli bacterium]
MNKKDIDKMNGFVEQISIPYALCFNPLDISELYLKRKVNNIFESCVYNNEFIKLHLNYLEKKGITDTSDGVESLDSVVVRDLKNNFCSYLQEKIREQLDIRKKEIRKSAKKKEQDKESKVKKGKTKETVEDTVEE